jgi:broad specificity phosphatase PhoE
VLYLVRHGRTSLNAAGLLRGHLDVPLDSVGWLQARRLGKTFAGVSPAVVLTSPLARAVETAEPIAAATGAPTALEHDLIDRDYGPWAGRSVKDVESCWGSVDAAPEVEPLDAFAARVTQVLRRLVDQLGGLPAVLVAHEAVNQVALATLVPNLAADPWSIRQRTGCWNRLEVTDGAWRAAVLDAMPGDGRHPVKRP